MKEIIREEFEAKGFNVTELQLNQFNTFLQMLIERNQSMNLVADADPLVIIRRHFLDSLSLMTKQDFRADQAIIDLGTGAGFPGIPLAIMLPSSFTLVDALAKRINFLTEVIEALKLTNVKLIHSRFEDLAHNPVYREHYDIAVSRAVASLNVLLEYTIPFLRINGILVAHKGSNYESEISTSNKALSLLSSELSDIIEYVDDQSIKRFILIIKKKQKTAKQFPRKAGTPKSKPIA